MNLMILRLISVFVTMVLKILIISYFRAPLAPVASNSAKIQP